MSEMAFSELEHVYEELAAAIDTAGPEGEALFLAKLVLTLAQKTGDLAAFRESVQVALRDLASGA